MVKTAQSSAASWSLIVPYRLDTLGDSPESLRVQLARDHGDVSSADRPTERTDRSTGLIRCRDTAGGRRCRRRRGHFLGTQAGSGIILSLLADHFLPARRPAGRSEPTRKAVGHDTPQP